MFRQSIASSHHYSTTQPHIAQTSILQFAFICYRQPHILLSFHLNIASRLHSLHEHDILGQRDIESLQVFNNRFGLYIVAAKREEVQPRQNILHRIGFPQAVNELMCKTKPTVSITTTSVYSVCQTPTMWRSILVPLYRSAKRQTEYKYILNERSSELIPRAMNNMKHIYIYINIESTL